MKRRQGHVGKPRPNLMRTVMHLLPPPPRPRTVLPMLLESRPTVYFWGTIGLYPEMSRIRKGKQRIIWRLCLLDRGSIHESPNMWGLDEVGRYEYRTTESACTIKGWVHRVIYTQDLPITLILQTPDTTSITFTIYFSFHVSVCEPPWYAPKRSDHIQVTVRSLSS